MSPTEAPEVARNPEEAFASLLEEITQAVEAGEAVDLAAYEAKFPEFAERLRRLVPALQALDEIGLSAVRSSISGKSSRVALSSVQGTLGDFRIVREIGRGGMGVVYEAEQISLGRRVALKVLPFAAILDPRHLQRFQNEARAAASLKHPHIVSVYSVGCERGVHYYAMEYVEGKTLAQVIGELQDTAQPSSSITDVLAHRAPSDEGAKSGSDDPMVDLAAPSQTKADTRREVQAGVATRPTMRTAEFFQTVARLGIQAAEALDHAHQMGIVHRDIKPSNLLVESRLPSPAGGRGAGGEGGGPRGEGRAAGSEGLHLWITDFGLAMTHSDPALTMTGDILGTLRYMSPEQASGKSRVLDHHTDIYSLGLTLYELLTLRPAFAGGDRQQLSHQILETDPPAPRQHNPSIPRDLETIILKATAKEPSQRYASAQQIADDLKRFLADEPIRARRPSLANRVAKWARRHRAATIAAACVCLGLLTLGVAAEWYRYQHKVAVERAVGESLAAARAFLEAGEYAAARQEVAEAQGRLSGANWQEGPLAATAASLGDEVSAKIRAQERFNKFRELQDLARGSFYHFAQKQQALENCRAALNLYGVVDAADWKTRREFEDLDAHHRTLVEEGALELLFLLARLEVATTRSAADRAQGHRRAIDALRRIEGFHGPVPAACRWMAESWKALGEDKLASDAAKRAENLPSRTAFDYYLLAEYQVYQGQFDKGLETFGHALNQQPDHFLSILRSGRCLYRLGRHEVAEAMLTGAVALNPHAAFAYYLRGVSRLEQRKFDLALADFAKILELNPQDYMGYYAQGLLLRDKGDAAQAVALFDKALQLSPGSFSSHFNRGLAYADLGQHEKAEVDFTRAIEMVKPLGEIEPEEQDWQDQMTIAYLNRALARARQPSRYSEALADADHARADWSKPFKWNPDGALKALNDLAWFLATCPDVRFRDPARAVELAKKAIELAPKSGTRWNTVGVAHYRAGNWQAAVSALEKSIALSKGHHYCIDAFFLAMAYWQQGRKDEARNCYGKAVEWMQKNKPQDEELLRFRAEAQQLLGIGEKPKAGKEKPK